ncbi:hypothetical protein ILYODFUR_014087 [Ilyodon furcidens]|uniref:Uncharacterized protein n=1 Tax=Ilyodon furcidens TaxID=33524 RepID=A0ABV0T972_9TELE
MEEKVAQATERTAAECDCETKPIQEFGGDYKRWTTAGVSAATHRCTQDMELLNSLCQAALEPAAMYIYKSSKLRRKRVGLFLSGLKSSFQIKVNFAFHL